jgi:hypothetical protein
MLNETGVRVQQTPRLPGHRAVSCLAPNKTRTKQASRKKRKKKKKKGKKDALSLLLRVSLRRAPACVLNTQKHAICHCRKGRQANI